jgi:PAS domain S-box-containing protein
VTSPYKSDEEEISGTISIVTEVTVSKREDELRAIAIAATKTHNSIMILDRFGNIEWVNEGFTHLSGYELYEVIDTKGEILYGDENGAEFLKQLNEVLKTRKTISCESRNLNKQGVAYWVVRSITPNFDTLGNIQEIVVIDTDITHQKKLEEELITANKMTENSLISGNRALEELKKAKRHIEETAQAKERFLASMSHEIRTPMNGILGLIDLLLNTELTPEQHKYLSAIKISGDTLMVVINDILDISKIDSGKMTFESIPVQLKEVAATAIDLFSVRAEEKGIKLTKVIDPSIPDFVFGDPSRLRQIIYNLLSNAIKFTDKGEVKFSISAKDEKDDNVLVEFAISDTGCGIPEDKLGMLFQDFTQLNLETPRMFGGSGLGLAITKRLIESQGGSIFVTSEVNKGTTFTVLLKFKRCTDKERISEYLNEKKALDLNRNLNARVLVAEDNNVNQLLSEKLLKEWNYKVDIVDNGKAAIEKLQEKEYDLVLLDIEMPIMDGYETAKYIREKLTGAHCNVPIIAVTAHADFREAEKCLQTGMNDYILKPFNAKELNKKLIRLLNNSSLKKGNNPVEYIDLKHLKSVFGSDLEFMKRTVNTFIKNLNEDRGRIMKYVKEKDFDGIRALAHKMKSSMKLMGIKQVAADLNEIERTAGSGRNMKSLSAMISKADAIFETIIEELKTKAEQIKISHNGHNNNI